MFPCKEAREPYEKDAKIRALFHSIEHKFFYCPTAILDTTIDKSSMQRLSNLGIPEGAFVIPFFGRHNMIKGYDILKKVAAEEGAAVNDLYSVIAATGMPVWPKRYMPLRSSTVMDQSPSSVRADSSYRPGRQKITRYSSSSV